MAPRLLVAGIAASALAGGCGHEIDSPTPGLASVAPDLVCTGTSVSSGGGTTVSLTGTEFTPMPSKTLKDPRQLILPKVTLTPVAALPGGTLPAAPVDVADDPANPSASRVHWASETMMGFDVDPTDNLPDAVYNVTVTNPDGSRAASLDQVLALVPPPVVSMVMPPAICDAEMGQTLVITGTSFLVYDGHTPTVTLGTGASMKTYTSTFDPKDCAAVMGTFTEQHVQLCTAITIMVPQGDFPVTSATKEPLLVTNPPPADCSSSSSPVDVTIEPPPTVTSVVPTTVCEGGSTITVNGTGFLDGATVSLVCGGTTTTSSETTVNADGTQITATFGGGATPGTCDVVVTNPDGCSDLPLPHKTIHVTTGPVVFFVDPEVVFNGINTDITVYATTVAAGALPADAVTIVPSGQTQPVTTLTATRDPNHNNRVHAIVPKGQAPGVYDLTLNDGTGCPATLTMAFTVTDTTTVTIAKVSPPFGTTSEDTAVEIFRDTTAAAPNDHPFVAVPHVFLNPHGGGNAIATELKAISFTDGDHLTGVVPAGTAPADYDVVVVNPDGAVGLLSYSVEKGYAETASSAPPPAVSGATPSSIVDQSGQKVTLAGTDFDANDAVSLDCVDPTGVHHAPNVTSTAPVCAGVKPNATCTQAITIDGSTLPLGSVCVVRVTNGDGTFGEYSAIGVTNSSLNLNAPVAGPDLNTGRRALVAAAGNATRTQRFVYAIGGDDGTAAGAMSSVEFAPVDPFGAIKPWVVQPIAMNAKRTLADAVTVGRYIYVVGGNDGTGPVATAERAKILSPLEVPEVDDLDVQLQAAGLDPGEYHYRISAVFTAGDTDNPGGESLASDEFTVRVPSFPGKKVALTLTWTAPKDALGATLPNVASYRVYRTKMAGDAPGTEVLLGTSNTTSFVDDGAQTPGTAVPLPLGTTGNFFQLPNLAAKREGGAVAVAHDPLDPSTFYVYALLGRSASTTANADYEYLTVTTAANGRQAAAAAWTPGLITTAKTPQSHARWQLHAWTVDGGVSSIYAGASYVFLGGGLTAAGTMMNTVEAGLVTPGGQLQGATVAATVFDDSPKDFSVSQAGYGVCAANGQLYSFGGENASPMKQAKSALLVTPAPQLGNQSWNDEGLSMTHGRYLLGSAVQSSFIFLLGGQTDEPSMASKTTELVIW
jgi:hypothetical protein